MADTPYEVRGKLTGTIVALIRQNIFTFIKCSATSLLRPELKYSAGQPILILDQLIIGLTLAGASNTNEAVASYLSEPYLLP